MDEKLRNDLIAILSTHAPSPAKAPITDATALFDGGLGLDSLGLLEVVTAIEERMGIALGEADLTEMVLANVGSFVKHVSGLVK